MDSELEEINLDAYSEHPYWAGRLERMCEAINTYMGQKVKTVSVAIGELTIFAPYAKVQATEES